MKCMRCAVRTIRRYHNCSARSAMAALRTVGVPARTSMMRKSSSAVDPNEDFFGKNKRLHRPMSPHLTIYQPQLTMIMSGFHRITGAGLGGAIYLGTVLYAVYPQPVAFYTELATYVPWWLAVSAKFILALPFTYHAMNGIRHLLWDIGLNLTLKGVYSSGWVVTGVSMVGALLLASY